MGFLSILSAIPGIKLDFSKNVNTHTNIHVGRDCVYQDGKVVGDEDAVSKILEGLSGARGEETLPVQVIDTNQEKGLSQTSAGSIRSSEVRLLKAVLPKEEIKPILLAKAAHCAILRKESRETVRNLLDTLEISYPRKGKRVFNLLTAGYFDELIIPMIALCNGNNDKDFEKFYVNLLVFHPTAIFVNLDASIIQIHNEIKKRLRRKTIPRIKIHAMGRENAKKKDDAIESLSVKSKLKVRKKKRANLNTIEYITTIEVVQNLE